MIIFILFLLFVSTVIALSYIENNSNLNSFNKAKYILDRKINIEIKNVEEGISIPKNILQTYKNIDSVPDYVIKNIKNKNKDWDYYFYDNDNVLKFLKEECGQVFVDKFNSFKKGAHQADLFRLCWLYVNGGVYIDIDTEILVPLDDIVKNIKNNLTIMQNDFRNNYYDDIVSDKLNCKHKTLINSFIVSNKGNPKIKKCIEDVMKIEQSDLEKNYGLILFVMQHTLKDEIEYQIFERSDNKLIPFVGGNMEMFDIKGNKIGNCKYKNYKDGVFN